MSAAYLFRNSTQDRGRISSYSENAPLEPAPLKLAPLKLAPLELASLQLAPLELIPLEFAPLERGTHLLKLAPLEFAPLELGTHFLKITTKRRIEKLISNRSSPGSSNHWRNGRLSSSPGIISIRRKASLLKSTR